MAARASFLLLCLAGAAVPLTALAQTDGKRDRDPRVELASKIPGARPEELSPSPIPGIYELARGTDIAYVSADGRYAIAGDLYDIASSDNLTENRRRDMRIKLLAAVPESEMIIFSPQKPRYTVTVFTDIDCGYCRKLHSEIAEYNRLGVRVRYLFYPRSGPGTASWKKAEEVWCSANRNEALTRAKRGDEIKASKPCKSTPVERHYELGRDFDLRGTPAIIADNGEMLPGYLPPAMLVEYLSSR